MHLAGQVAAGRFWARRRRALRGLLRHVAAVSPTGGRAERAEPAEAEGLQTSPVDFGVQPGQASDAYAAQRAAMAQLEQMLVRALEMLPDLHGQRFVLINDTP